MHPARVAELLEPFLIPLPKPDHSEPSQKHSEEPAVLSSAQLQSISTYIDILLRWNARINLTAIRDPEDIVTRHFGESLFAARHLFPKRSGSRTSRERHRVSRTEPGAETNRALAPESAANDQRPATSDRLSVADLGSGAGFPGLPIKLWAPYISLTLIESNHKKAAFLSEVTRALTLTDVDIQNTRAETLTTTFDVVTFRAVERFDAILPTAAALVAPAGRLALLISTAQQDPARSTLAHLVGSELTWSEPVPIPHSRSRILLVASRRIPEPDI